MIIDMEQTGIRYLAEQLKYYDFEKLEQSYEFKITVAKFNELIEKAEAIEKKQIIEAYDYEANADMHDYSSGEQYYDQTFKR